MNQKLTPFQIPGSWSSVSAGNKYTMAIKKDGTLWAWGYNNLGMLGIGSTADTYTPVKVGTDDKWDMVSAAWDHTMAVKTDGSLWGWGSNNGGRLGYGTVGGYLIDPLQIGSQSDWAYVAAGSIHTLGMKKSGAVFAWGDGDKALGIGTTLSAISTPKPITAFGGAFSKDFTINVYSSVDPPTITTTALPTGKVGVNYNATMTATGQTPITWSVSSGSLPDGVTLNATTGAITGKPTVSNNFTFTIKATNVNGDATKTFTVGVLSSGGGGGGGGGGEGGISLAGLLGAGVMIAGTILFLLYMMSTRPRP